MRELVRKIRARSATCVALTICALFAAVLILEIVISGKIGGDFGVFWRTANGPVSQAYVPREFGPFAYPPTMLLWIAPLSLFPKWPSFAVFALLSGAAFVVAFRRYISRPAMVLAMLSPPMIRCLRNGQPSALFAALILWACATGNRIAAGAAIGAIASIKPQLVAMAPLMLALNRDWRAFLAAGGAFMSILLLSLALLGTHIWVAWLGSLDGFRHTVASRSVLDIAVAPYAAAHHFDLPPAPFWLLGAVAGAALVYHCRAMPPLERATAIAMGSILASPYAMAYDMVTVVPFLAMAIFKGRILAAGGLVAVLNPLPLLASSVELARAARSDEANSALKAA